eukprot:TRINITY_DN3663_c0_g1_i1.p1 TRINITY_DN3663_c0_g1~~TRINITY_DN3663_c0_g1_i1.p1  ORF type:complete len:707 (+),score=227.58 TRINITY_DN3663_c0_g1_i1:204-2324(+)
MSSFSYPNPVRDDSVVESKFPELPVSDPYRWMEDPENEKTRKFVSEENELSRGYFKGCPYREDILTKLTSLWDYPKSGVPHREGDRYYLRRNNGLQNQDVLYVQKDLESKPEVFLDPNVLSEDGTISLQNFAFSEDGSLFAYCLSSSGSDWVDIHFRNVSTGEKSPEVLEKVKYSSLAWTHDHKGIFYSAYSEHTSEATGRNASALSNHKLYYHVVGTTQDKDVLVVEFPEHPQWIISSEVSDCGRYLFIFVSEDCENNLLYYADLQALPEGEITKKLELTQVAGEFEYEFEYITNMGSKCVFRSNRGSPNYSLLVIDLQDLKTWTELVPEQKDAVLNWAICVNQDKLVLCYMKDVLNTIQIHELPTGKFLSQLPLPLGSVRAASGSKKHKEFFYKMSSMISPGEIYWADLSKSPMESTLYYETKIEGFDSSQYEVKQVFYNSTDGTKIPLFIGSKKGYPLDGKSPCLLYGYGGFNKALSPSFSISNLFFIQHFGYMAIANIRGGGEYGKIWNNEGKLFKKQNCFTDFQCAGEYLIKEGYTCKDKLSIMGGSNGGLLVGACINQRPDLFGGAVAQCGVMDMLRFHKFTIGHLWISDYGNPEEKDHFANNLKYSPLHNVREPEGKVQYPATLLTVADHDDRVVTSHSLKLIAELQHVLGKLPKQTHPLMIRIDTKAGHGGGTATSKSIEEVADSFSFLVRALGYEFK